jgi:uncharacterized protein YecE (DUF72 family)
MTAIDLQGLPPGLRLGTSSFSSPDWCGTFYPEELRPEGFLTHYAGKLSTVEIDATWHSMPARRTFEAWAERVPEGFVFSLKTPKSITHSRYLQDCGEEWARFLGLTEILGSKRGPILLQFPYVSRGQDPEEYRSGREFLRRLRAFLPQLPRDGRFVVEVRNRTWIGPELLDLLRRRGIALALVDYYTMPGAADLLRRIDPVTADFGYIRFLGNHRAMDHQVARARERGERSSDWGELILDRTEDVRAWIPPIQELLNRLPEVYAYFNNHYAGFAPGSIELFVRLWNEQVVGSASGSG